jgi:hypothetical protein
VFIACLNIGSLGFFWYDLPRQTSRYFESVRDLDTPDMKMEMSKGRGLLELWKQNALSEKNLYHAIQAFAAFSSMPDSEAAPIFGPYLHGLALLSKSDIHLSCEDQARDNFLECLRSAMKHFGDWDEQHTTLRSALDTAFVDLIPEPENREIVFEVLTPPHRTREGPLGDAVSAKRLADLYLVLVADRLWDAKLSSAA